MIRRHNMDAEGKAVEKLQCDKCPYSSYYKYDLNFHMKKHDPDRLHKCTVSYFVVLSQLV